MVRQALAALWSFYWQVRYVNTYLENQPFLGKHRECFSIWPAHVLHRYTRGIQRCCNPAFRRPIPDDPLCIRIWKYKLLVIIRLFCTNFAICSVFCREFASDIRLSTTCALWIKKARLAWDGLLLTKSFLCRYSACCLKPSPQCLEILRQEVFVACR